MDPLSGLPGADDFAALLAREEMRRSRTGEQLTVAVLDLDGLRAVNARFGAAAGTEMLRHCAAALHRTLRGVDALARTGADDFAVLLHATDARNANIWADRFEDELERCAVDHPAAPLTCSIGIADSDEGIADSDEGMSLLEVAARARRRMEVVQTVRKLRRARGGGD